MEQTIPGAKLVALKEAALTWGVSVDTMERYCKASLVVCEKRGGVWRVLMVPMVRAGAPLVPAATTPEEREQQQAARARVSRRGSTAVEPQEPSARSREREVSRAPRRPARPAARRRAAGA